MADFSLDTIIKLPNSQKLLVLGAAIAVIIGAYVYFIHMPARVKLQQHQEQLTKLQAQYEEQQKVLANLPKFRKELQQMELKLQESLKQLPNTREIPSLLTNISTLARECGLEIILFQPKPESNKGFYAEIPVEMNVFGRYHNLGYFFDRVSKLNRIVNISNLKMKAHKSKSKTTQRGSLEASFQAVTFKFIEQKKATKSGQKKRRKRR